MHSHVWLEVEEHHGGGDCEEESEVPGEEGGGGVRWLLNRLVEWRGKRRKRRVMWRRRR